MLQFPNDLVQIFHNLRRFPLYQRYLGVVQNYFKHFHRALPLLRSIRMAGGDVVALNLSLLWISLVTKAWPLHFGN